MKATNIAPVDGATAAITDGNANSTGNCPLLELPAELRNRIYEYVLGPPNRMRIDSSSARYSSACKLQFPPLLRTCQQIRAEASGIWYSSTTFIWYRPSKLSLFADLVGDKNFQAIAMILDEFDWHSVESAELSNLGGQECLHVRGHFPRSGVINSRYRAKNGDFQITSRAVERKGHPKQ